MSGKVGTLASCLFLGCSMIVFSGVSDVTVLLLFSRLEICSESSEFLMVCCCSISWIGSTSIISLGSAVFSISFWVALVVVVFLFVVFLLESFFVVELFVFFDVETLLSLLLSIVFVYLFIVYSYCKQVSILRRLLNVLD